MENQPSLDPIRPRVIARSDLEELIRDSAKALGDPLITGSLAVFAQFPQPPADLVEVIEAEYLPDGRRWGRWSLLENLQMEMLLKHLAGQEELDEVDSGKALNESLRCLPREWEKRLVACRTRGTDWVIGWCVEVNDLAVSKLVEGSELGVEFTRVLLQHGMADAGIIQERIPTAPTTGEDCDRALAQLSQLLAEGRPRSPDAR